MKSGEVKFSFSCQFFSIFIIQKYWIHFERLANEKILFFFPFFCSRFHILTFDNSLPYIFFSQKTPKNPLSGVSQRQCSPSLLFKHFQYSLERQDTRDDIHLIKPLYFHHPSSSLWASFLHVAEHGEPIEAVSHPRHSKPGWMDLGQTGLVGAAPTLGLGWSQPLLCFFRMAPAHLEKSLYGGNAHHCTAAGGGEKALSLLLLHNAQKEQMFSKC